MSSLAISRHRGSEIRVKSNRRLASDIWTGRPITSVKSHSSSSKTGRLAPSGRARPASRHTSTPANTGTCCGPAEEKAALIIGFMW